MRKHCGNTRDGALGTEGEGGAESMGVQKETGQSRVAEVLGLGH